LVRKSINSGWSIWFKLNVLTSSKVIDFSLSLIFIRFLLYPKIFGLNSWFKVRFWAITSSYLWFSTSSWLLVSPIFVMSRSTFKYFRNWNLAIWSVRPYTDPLLSFKGNLKFTGAGYLVCLCICWLILFIFLFSLLMISKVFKYLRFEKMSRAR
jgi:hypothetical protein